MVVPNFDPNQWYSIFLAGGQALSGTWLFNRNHTTGASLMKSRDASDWEQLWQVFPLNSTTWTLRSQAGGPTAYLSSKWNASAQTQIVPIMAIRDIADTSAFWTFDAWDDGTWKLSNLANGTGNRLQKNPLLCISSDAPAPPTGQGWNYTAIRAIDDPRYSSVSLLGTVFGTATSSSLSTSIASSTIASTISATANPTTNSNPFVEDNKSSSPGISTAAKAGIGAAIGIVALIALVVLGLFFLRKRRRHQPYTSHIPDSGTYTTYNEAPSTTKYELHCDAATKPMLFEAPSNERAAELPGH